MNMLEPVRATFKSTKKNVLAPISHGKRPSFDFLTLHYMYIIGMTLLGSLLVIQNLCRMEVGANS